MKKLIAISLAAVMIFSFVALSPILAEQNQEQEQEQEREREATTTATVKPESNDIKTRQLMSSLEKILTPEQIKNFTNIVKQGNSLYGVRKMASSTEVEHTASTTLEKNNGNANNLSRQFEKIAAPWLLNQYEQIKKVGTALWGLKKMDKNQEQKKASSTPKYITAAQSACVISAIKTKDTALKTNNEATSLAFNNAISARTTCQEAAINATVAATSTPDLIKQQRSELQLCLQAFKESAHSVKEKAAANHKTVWTAYLNELKVCGSSTSATEALMVEDGGGDILEGVME